MHAGIVGMGVMGRVLALALYNAGWQVTLFDQHEGDSNCSLAAAGLLTPSSELDRAPQLICSLGQQALQIDWPALLRQLNKPVYFQQRGSLVLSHAQDQAEWHYFQRRLRSQLQQHDCYQMLSQDHLVQLEPELGQFNHAYYFPEEAQIDCQSLMSALKIHLETKGINFLTNTPVVTLEPRLIITKTQIYRCDWVFDCRGLGAKTAFPDLRALRGELIWLDAPEVNLQRPVRLLHPRYSLYLVPRPDNVYLIGASEIEAEDYSPVSLRTSLELLSAAYSIHAGFAEARIIKTVTHCRPTLANHLPRIQLSEGLIAINGLYRHGYLIAPALAQDVIHYLKNNSVNHPSLWSIYD